MNMGISLRNQTTTFRKPPSLRTISNVTMALGQNRSSGQIPRPNRAQAAKNGPIRSDTGISIGAVVIENKVTKIWEMKQLSDTAKITWHIINSAAGGRPERAAIKVWSITIKQCSNKAMRSREVATKTVPDNMSVSLLVVFLSYPHGVFTV